MKSKTFKNLLLATTTLVALSFAGYGAHAQELTSGVVDGDNTDNDIVDTLYDFDVNGGSIEAATEEAFTDTQIGHDANITLRMLDSASMSTPATNTIDVNGGGDVIVNSGVTVSNATNADAIGVYAADSTLTINGIVTNSSTGDAIDMTNTAAGESIINLNTTTGQINGPVALGTGDTINFTGNGTNDYTGDLRVGNTAGTQTLDVLLDADTDTLTIGGTIDSIDSFVLQEGQVTFGGAVTNGGTIDIQNGAELTTLSTLSISGDIDLADDAIFTSGGTINASSINITNGADARLLGDTVNAELNLQSSTLRFDATTVFAQDVFIGGNGANTIFNNGADMTLSGASTDLTLTNTGGGTGNFNFGFDGGAGGSNELAIAGDRNYNFNNTTIQNFETLTFTSSATTTFNGTTTTGFDDIDINGAGTLVFDEADDAFSVTNDIDISGGGTLDISFQTVTVNEIDLDDGTLDAAGASIIGNVNINTDGDIGTTAISSALQFGAGDHSLTFSGDGDGTTDFGSNALMAAIGSGDVLNYSNSGGTIQNGSGAINGWETINVDGGGAAIIAGFFGGTEDINISNGSTLTIDDSNDNFSIANDIDIIGGGTLDVSNQTFSVSEIDLDDGTLNTTGATVNGDVNLSTQTGATTVLTGGLTFGSGDNTLTVSGDGGGTFTGLEDDTFDGGDGTDIFTFNHTGGTFTSTGDISNFSHLRNTSTGNLTLNGALTNINNLTVSGAGTMTVDEADDTFTIGNEIDIDGGGTLDISNQNVTITNAAGIDLNDGTLNVTGATINGNVNVATDVADSLIGGVSQGTGDNTMTFAGDASSLASLSNTLSGGLGTDDLNISTTTNTFTLSGTIDSYETILVDGGSGAVVLSGDVSNGSVVAVQNAGSALTYTTGTLDVDNVSVDGGASFTYNSSNTYAGNVTEFEADEDQTVTINGDADLTGAGNVISLGGGADSLTLDVGDVTGNIATGLGDDVIDVNGGTFNGSFSTGLGSDTVTLADAVFNGTFDGGSNQIVTIDGGTVQFSGALNNVSTLRMANNTTLTYSNTGAFTADIVEDSAGTNQTVVFSEVADYSGSDVNLGTGTDILTVNANGNVTLGNVTSAATTTFDTNANVTLAEDISVGDITFNNATNAFATTLDATGNVDTITTSGSITVNGANTIDLTIADASILKLGQSYTIVTDTGLGSSLSGTFDLADSTYGLFINMAEDTTTNDVYAVNVESTAEDVYNDATDIEGNAGNLASVTNAILSAPSGNTELDAAHTALMSATTTAGAEDIVEKLAPTVDSGYMAGGISVNSEVNGAIDVRLASLRNGSETGMAAGSYAQGLQIWTQAFGQYAEQEERDGVKGYDSETVGAAFGADTNQIHDNLRLGLAMSYAYTDVESDNANRTEAEVNSYQATVYGEYTLPDQTFVNANLSYAYNDIDQTRYNVGVGNDTAQADFDSQQFGLDLSIGRDLNVTYPDTNQSFIVTPKLNANYLHISVDDYTETGAGGLSLQNVDTEEFQVLDLGVSVDAVWDVALDDGSLLQPSAHAGYSYGVMNDSVESTASFTGGGPAFKTQGFEPDEHTFNVGAGLTYQATNNWEIRAQYDFEFKDDYQAHAGLVRAKYSF